MSWRRSLLSFVDGFREKRGAEVGILLQSSGRDWGADGTAIRKPWDNLIELRKYNMTAKLGNAAVTRKQD